MIINADDYCLNETVTNAIKKSIDDGIVDRTTCLVNFVLFKKTINDSWSKQKHNVIGLHLNLTEGKPLTNDIIFCKRFVGPDGFFINNSKNRKGTRLIFLHKKEKEALKKEIDAQFRLFRQFNQKSDFFDSHHHIHTVYSIFKIIIPIAKKYNFRSTRISRNIGISGRNFFVKIYKFFINKYIKKHFVCTSYFGSYVDYLQNKTKQKNYANSELMCHPDFKNGELIDLSSNLNILLYKRFKNEQRL